MITCKINDIFTDGYERFAEITTITNEKLVVHFVEFNEYLNQNELSKQKKQGDTLVGEIRIDLVSSTRKQNSVLMHKQTIPESSHIVAIVEVVELVDEYSIYAKTSICEQKMLIEFENIIKYNVKDIIYIEGSLEIKCV